MFIMASDNFKNLLFVQQRLQILHLGKHFDEFSDSYIYAWDRGVYPLFSDTDGSVSRKPHELYEEFFRTSKQEVEFLTKRFNSAWDNNEKLTFYKLEDELHVYSHSVSGWTRRKLLNISRYLFLENCYDAAFWENLTLNGACPSEAHSIRREFDRESDVYLE
jgi:antitoxin MazE